MTNRTWTGGHDGNDAGSAANWSPPGAPQPGDDLTVVSGTLEISPGDLAGNTLHLNDALVSGGDPSGNGAPVVLDLNGWGATASIDGSLNFGDPLTANVTSLDFLDATGGFDDISGSINLADHAHLYVTGGQMQFFYGGELIGGEGSLLTNYGRIDLGASNGPTDAPNVVAHPGTVSVLVNGSGTLAFHGYHNGYGYAGISAPITSAQTVELNPGSVGMTLTLFDPGDFHAMLRVDQVVGRGNVSVEVKGVQADGFSILPGDRVMLTNGGRAVDLLRVADAGAVPITASYGTDATTLTFHINPLGA